MEEVERLFRLQLRLKQDSVNGRRRQEEAGRLRSEAVDQVREALREYREGAVAVWMVVNGKEGSVGEQAEVRMDAPEALGRLVSTILQDPSPLVLQIADAGEHLPFDRFMFVLGVFSFNWSRERAGAFVDFLAMVGPKHLGAFMEVLVVQPNVQVFFGAALKPLFDELPKIERAPLRDLVLGGLDECAGLIPAFLKRAIRLGDHRGRLFWNVFLHTFLVFFPIFGFAPSEFTVFFEDELRDLVRELGEFFEGAEGDGFLERVFERDEICVLPTESALRAIVGDIPLETIVTEDETYLVQIRTEGNMDPDGNAQGEGEGEERKESVVDAVREFLLNAKLIRLDRTESKAILCFQRLAALSSVTGDAGVEAPLEKIDGFLRQNQIGLGDLCEMVERGLGDEEGTGKHDLLKEMAGYSGQKLCLERLIKRAKSIRGSCLSYANFGIVKREMEGMDEIPSDFWSAFEMAMERFPRNPEVKVHIHPLLIQRMRVGERFLEDEELKEEDERMYEFLEKEGVKWVEEKTRKMLEPFERDGGKLALIREELRRGFGMKYPMSVLEHVHRAYQMLSPLLRLEGEEEVGADQLLPFVIYVTGGVKPRRLVSYGRLVREVYVPRNPSLNVLGSGLDYDKVNFLTAIEDLVSRREEWEKREKRE